MAVRAYRDRDQTRPLQGPRQNKTLGKGRVCTKETGADLRRDPWTLELFHPARLCMSKSPSPCWDSRKGSYQLGPVSEAISALPLGHALAAAQTSHEWGWDPLTGCPPGPPQTQEQSIHRGECNVVWQGAHQDPHSQPSFKLESGTGQAGCDAVFSLQSSGR